MKSRGFTLLYAVLAVALLLGAVLSITSITVKQLTLSSIGQQSQIAFYAADAGTECIHYWDSRHNAFDDTAQISSIKCGGNLQSVNTLVTNPDNSELKETTVTYKPDMSNPPEVTAKAGKQKHYDTIITSSGHNISTVSPRKVERTLVTNYTAVPSQLCFNNGKVMVLVDLNSSFNDMSNSQLKTELKAFVHRLMDPDPLHSGPSKVGFYSYNNNSSSASLVPLQTRDNISTLEDGINNLPEGGSGTDLKTGIQKALAQSKGPNNYIVIITGTDPGDTNTAIAAADAAKLYTGAAAATTTIYTIGYNTDTRSCSSNKNSSATCAEYYERYIAGSYKHSSDSASLTNVPYYDRYSYIAHDLTDLRAILASLANCR